MDRLRIFNRAGTLVSEFNSSVSRAWVIGEKTTANFTVANNADFCNDTVLNFGNWVVVENDKLPTWCGTIGSRDWGSRSITVSAFSPEFLMSQRIGVIEKVLQTSAGGIFAELIEQVNTQESTILRAGVIYKSAARQETINPTQLSDDLSRIYKRSREEYSWRVSFSDGGTLIVYGDWAKRLGIDTSFTLYEGRSGGNIEAGNRVLLEDAPEGNYVLGYGNGQTWSTRPLGASKDTLSINKYGLIQKSISYYGVTTVAAVTQNATDELAVKKNPTATYNVNALDIGDTFANMRLGNTMDLKMQNIGFTTGNIGTDTRVRIVGMVYNPATSGKLELALENV